MKLILSEGVFFNITMIPLTLYQQIKYLDRLNGDYFAVNADSVFKRITIMCDVEELKIRFQIMDEFIQIRMMKGIPIPLNPKLLYYFFLRCPPFPREDETIYIR